jgi:hypothetical protein
MTQYSYLLAINAKQLWSFVFLTRIIQVKSSAQEFTVSQSSRTEKFFPDEYIETLSHFRAKPVSDT